MKNNKKKILAILFALILLTSCSFAQNDFKLVIKMRVDNKRVSGPYTVTVLDFKTMCKTSTLVGGRFKLFLYYDSDYEIQFTKANCNTKIMRVSTYTPDRWIIINTIFLNSNRSDTINVGGVRYSEDLNNFEQYKF